MYCFGILYNESIPHTTSNSDDFTDYSTVIVQKKLYVK